MAECPHWIDLDSWNFNCERPLDHKGKHHAYDKGEAVGPRPKGGRARKEVQVKIEWDR